VPALGLILLALALPLPGAPRARAQDIPPAPNPTGRPPRGGLGPGLPSAPTPPSPEDLELMGPAARPRGGLNPGPRGVQTEPPPAGDIDLNLRYRFREPYATEPGGEGISQYEVAFREESETVDQVEQGAPVRSQRVVHVRYTEHPAEVGPGDERFVPALVRRYDGARITPNPLEKYPAGAHFLEDLTIWYETHRGEYPDQIVLTPDRPLLMAEYKFSTDAVPWMPNLAYLLPEEPVRLHDTWLIPETPLTALLGINVVSGSVRAELLSVAPAPDGGRQVATIGLGGSVATDLGQTLVNARILYTFAPVEPRKAPARRFRDEGPVEDGEVLEGVGGITEVRLAQDSTWRGDEQTLPRTVKRRLVLQRRWPGQGAPLALPEKRPVATPENSWVVSIAPGGKFHLKHPHEMTPDYQFFVQPNQLGLRAPDNAPPALVVFELLEGEQPRPDAIFETMIQEKRQGGFQVLETAPAHLPSGAFPGMDVYRREAAVTAPAAAGSANIPRQHFVGYVAQFPRNLTLTVRASTLDDRPNAFRDQVESMLKTFRLGPPGAPAPAAGDEAAPAVGGAAPAGADAPRDGADAPPLGGQPAPNGGRPASPATAPPAGTAPAAPADTLPAPPDGGLIPPPPDLGRRPGDER
jgi:hypothetical protein